MLRGITPARVPIGNDKTLDPSLAHYCAPKHWDPTRIYYYTVPDGPPQALPMDPRPWTKVCLQYINSGPATAAPSVPNSLVVTGAGEFYPPGRYAEAIDNESRLRRLDRPLNEDLLPGRFSCFPKQYVLPDSSDALQQYVLLPPQVLPASKMVREMESPSVIRNITQYKCSEEAMVCDLKATPKVFNNFTSLQKYNQKDNRCGTMLWQTNNGKDPSASNLPRPVSEHTM